MLNKNVDGTITGTTAMKFTRDEMLTIQGSLEEHVHMYKLDANHPVTVLANRFGDEAWKELTIAF